jgi:hypothetical protein
MALSGTSVLGVQMLHEGINAASKGFLLAVARASVVPPRRIGFYYIELYSTLSATPGSLVNSGVLYLPGVRLTIVLPGPAGTDRYRYWVDWNEPGLNWQISILGS